MTTEMSAKVSMTRTCSTHTFTSWDGTDLFYRAWIPKSARKEAILLFHRGHEHSGRWQDTVDGLNLPDIPVFAWDQRGHGHSPGERGWAPSLSAIVQDLESFVRHVSKEYGIPVETMTVIAHSVGAVVATTWVHDFAPKIRALVVATPAFKVRLYVPFAVEFLRLKQMLLGPGFVRSYVKARMITHDADEAKRYTDDPLVFPQIAVNMLLDLYDAGMRVVADAGAIQVPTMVIVAEADWVVDKNIQRQFYDRLSSQFKRLEVLPGFYHAVFHETERRQLWSKIREFYQDPEIRPVDKTRLLDADKRGYTYDEFERLRGPGPIGYSILNWLIGTFGQLSRGIRVGLRRGFDSGIMLDYVYRNRAQGFTFIGKLIDRFYLDSIGWRGIRIRKIHMEQLLTEVIGKVHAEGRHPHILDIAAGPGRYILETIAAVRPTHVTAHLRDYRTRNVERARKLATELGLEDIRAETGDAFDAEALAAITPKPTIGIVSGLYELFPLNRSVQTSLNGMYEAIEPGGWLLYTGQPWHPQLELIARALGNREGQPWIMRRRTQAEMDALVEEAGFVKVAEKIDQWGIFSVSVARRP